MGASAGPLGHRDQYEQPRVNVQRAQPGHRCAAVEGGDGSVLQAGSSTGLPAHRNQNGQRRIYFRIGRRADAKFTLQDALRIRIKVLPPSHPDIAWAIQILQVVQSSKIGWREKCSGAAEQV